MSSTALTLARLGVGVALLVAAWAAVLGDGVSWVEALTGLVAFPVGIVLLHALLARTVGRPFSATGGLGFCANLGLGAILFSTDATRELTSVFAGASLLLTAARGYAGCEVLAVLRRDRTMDRIHTQHPGRPGTGVRGQQPGHPLRQFQPVDRRHDEVVVGNRSRWRRDLGRGEDRDQGHC